MASSGGPGDDDHDGSGRTSTNGDQTDEAGAAVDKAAQAEAEREQLLNSVAAGKLDTLQERVAWILNRHPGTRDSDLALQILYWEEFESDLGGGSSISKRDLFKLTRYSSIAGARAKIQNTYKLFQASVPIRQRRGTLAEEERAKAAEQQIDAPFFDVFADESGKSGAKHLIVGSLWVLHAPEMITFRREIRDWRTARGWHKELHFKEIDNGTLPHYIAFADLLVERNAAFSFKALSVERAGVRSVDAALEQLFFHLLVRGVEHEHQTRRAPLPRTLQVWKDEEEPGRDKLMLVGLKQKVEETSTSKFDGRLSTAEFRAIKSKAQIFVQAADLYVSSLNRVLNAEGKRTGPKDQFADYFLGALGVPRGPETGDQVGDMAIHIAL